MLIPPPYPVPVVVACPYGQLAIPDLPWLAGTPPLALSTMASFRAMFTVVQRAGYGATLARYLPHVPHAGALVAADINALETAIDADIASAVVGGPPGATHSLLPHIAVGIHLWGGRMGRAAFLSARGGFTASCPMLLYADVVRLLLTHPAGVPLPGGNWPAILAAKAGFNKIGISFLSKHLCFWSRAPGAPIRLPILDRLVQHSFIGPYKSAPTWREYVPYVNQLYADTATLALRPGLGAVTVTAVERQLFNWLRSTPASAWLR